MKKVIISLISLCMLISLSNQAVAQDKGKGVETVVFSVSMNCENCGKKIKDNIRFEKGVTKIKTDLKAQTVEITYKADKTTKKKLALALEKLGYKPTE